MFNVKIILATVFIVKAYGLEDNGINNYLFKTTEGKDYYISYSSEHALPFKEGDRFEGRITAECELGVNLDEVMSDKLNLWIHYEDYICNALKLELLDE